jgi:phosphoesterase RecJ-like protein
VLEGQAGRTNQSGTLSPRQAEMPSYSSASSAIDWERLISILRNSSVVVLTSHLRPDCDALGSELAVSELLEFLGKEVRIVNAFEVPRHLRFIDPEGKLHRLQEPESQAFLARADLLFILDTSAWAQLGAMGEVIRSTSATKVILDHHITADDLGAERFCDPTAEATGRLVYELARRAGMPIGPRFAWYIFLALATDTGWFRFSSVTAATYHLAGEMVAHGVSPTDVYRQLYEAETLGRVRLIGCALGRAQLDGNGKLVYSWLYREDFQLAGALPSDSEDIINLLLAVDGVEAAVLFIEQPSGDMKVSLRSKGQLDCAAIAARFGGGGHRSAAGIYFNHPWPLQIPPEVEPRTWLRGLILDAVRQAMA